MRTFRYNLLEYSEEWLHKTSINPDSNYRLRAILKHSVIHRCTSDTQLLLHNAELDWVTYEHQPEEIKIVETEEERKEQMLVLIEPKQE